MRRLVPAHGLPTLAVLVIASLLLAGLLVVSFTSGADRSVGPSYAAVRVGAGGCELDRNRSRNAIACRRLRPHVYVVSFAQSLAGSAPVASRGTCCLGTIGVDASGDRGVLLAIGPPRRYPLTVTLHVP